MFSGHFCVGFTGTKLRNGFYPTGANFVKVDGSTTRNLNDLVVVGYNKAEGCSSTVFLQKLDKDGNVLDSNTWEWLDLEDPDEGTFYGWYSDKGEGSDEALEVGEGVWIQAPDDTYSIQVNGQVYDQPVPVALRAGFTLCVNPVPMALNLNNAVVTGYNKSEPFSSTVFLQKLDKDGNVEDSNTWEWLDMEDPDEGTFYGWYSDKGEGSDEPLAVGEGVWVQAPDDTYGIQFPAAL